MDNIDIILTEERLIEVRDYFLRQPAFAFDTETWGPSRNVPHLNQVCWLSMATYGGAVVIPCGHPVGRKIGETQVPATYANGKPYMKTVPVWDDPPPQLSVSRVFEILRPLFLSTTIVKIAHNAVFDLATVTKYLGEVPAPPYDDTIVISWLLNENIKRQGLKYRVREMYHHDYDQEDVGKCVEKHPFLQVANYAYLDALYCWLLYTGLLPILWEEPGLRRVLKLERDVLNTLIGMKLSGAQVDEGLLERLKEELTVRVEECRANVYKAAGRIFNVNSTPQKQKLLFGPKPEGEGLRPWKLTKGGEEKMELWKLIPREEHAAMGVEQPGPTWYSTDSETLESFPKNKLAAALLEYQETNKILGTYVIGYLGEEGNDDKPRRIFDGHIHADFVQYGTATGRFSCREPNLQNIPRPSSDLGKLVRGIFIAEPGHKLVVADFGQIELVVLAHYIGSGRLYDGFWAGIDPHRVTAAGVLGKAPEDVTRDERQDLGKTLGFAVVYGAGPGKVASMMGKPVTEAKRVLAEHRRQFPEVYSFRQSVLNGCRRYGYVETILGRKRRLPEINSPDDKRRKYSERQAFNAVIQGGAADLNKLALVRCDADPRMGSDIALTLSVHDELVLQAPAGRAEVAADILREAMTGEGIQSLLRVPLTADIKICDRWSEAK